MAQNNQDNILTFRYHFNLETGEQIDHTIHLNKETITSEIEQLPEDIPQWAKINENKCNNCTLQNSEYCPIAIRLIDPIDKFHKYKSHHKAKVTVETKERQYTKETDIQDGLRSLFGLIMATSGCPSMEAFRPMALFHLPFASIQETIFRTISMYLVRRFTQHKNQSSMPISIEEIKHIYDKIEEVNLGTKKRISQFAESDSTLNAIIILDAIASMTSFQLEETLESLEFDNTQQN